jgi:hypothetical protein
VNDTEEECGPNPHQGAMRAGGIKNVRVERGYFWESEFDKVGRPVLFFVLIYLC